MLPWETIDQTQIPESGESLTLRKRGDEYSIRTPETELMNSRVHGSEDMLAELACSRLKKQNRVHMLIGGLGMGYTLAAALAHMPEDSRITVSELVPAVVKWNQSIFGHLADMPLKDNRVNIVIEDVHHTIRKKNKAWNIILLDVDNGPAGLTQKSNNRLYSSPGLKNIYDSLKPEGILAVWSAADDPQFTKRLKSCRFTPDTIRVRARKSGKGGRHTIWLAQK